MWTTRHGRLLGPEATLVQVDLDAAALGAHRPIHLGVVGDSGLTADAEVAALRARGGPPVGARTPSLADRLVTERRWQDVPTTTGAVTGSSTRGR